MEDTFEVKILLRTPIENAWKLITEPQSIEKWYAFGGAKVDLQVGGSISFQWDEHGVYKGVIEKIEPLSILSFRYSPFEANVEPSKGHMTKVTITLSKQDDAETLVTISESGFQELELSADEKAENLATNRGAWLDSLELLKTLAEG